MHTEYQSGSHHASITEAGVPEFPEYRGLINRPDLQPTMTVASATEAIATSTNGTRVPPRLRVLALTVR